MLANYHFESADLDTVPAQTKEGTMPDEPRQDIATDRIAKNLRPDGARLDPKSIGRKTMPSRPGSTDGSPLRKDSSGLRSNDGDADVVQGDELVLEMSRDDSDGGEESEEIPPPPAEDPEDEEESEEIPPPPVDKDDEEDEETITTGEETTYTPPSADEMARIVQIKIGGNRTPDGSDHAVLNRGGRTGPLLQGRTRGNADPSPLDDGVHLNEPGPTPREQLGQPPKPIVGD
jgi:hypothetical protein